MNLDQLIAARGAGQAVVRIDEVYDLLGVSRATAFRLAAADALPVPVCASAGCASCRSSAAARAAVQDVPGTPPPGTSTPAAVELTPRRAARRVLARAATDDRALR